VFLLERIAELGPNSGHLAHMPGHIYFHNHQFGHAVDHFIKSYKIDSLYNEQYKYGAQYNWNLIHNLHFLCVSLVETGRYEEALKWQKVLNKAYLKVNDEDFASAFVASLSRVQIPWRFKQWDECIDQVNLVQEEMASESWTAKYYFDAMEEYFLARQSFHLDKEDSLSLHIKKFNKIVKSDKIYAKEGEGNVEDVAGYKQALEVYGKILNFCALYFGEYKETFDADFNALNHEFGSIVVFDPPEFPGTLHEIAAEILLNHRKYEDAIVYLNEAAVDRPGSATIQLQLARMNAKAGNLSQAQTHLDKFYALWIDADKTLLEFEMARLVKIQIDRK